MGKYKTYNAGVESSCNRLEISTIPFITFLLERHLFSCSEQNFLSKRANLSKILQFDWLTIFSLTENMLWAKNLYWDEMREIVLIFKRSSLFRYIDVLHFFSYSLNEVMIPIKLLKLGMILFSGLARGICSFAPSASDMVLQPYLFVTCGATAFHGF